MSYIGKEPQTGAYNMLDNLTASATASYSLTLDSVAFVPESANHLLVSLNGSIQKAGSSYTVSGSTLTFSSTLASSDSIDFVLALGNVLDIGTPSDATVTNAKTNFVSTSSAAGLQIKGDGTTDGTLQLNCSQNSHGIKLKSPNHASSSSYTLTFPATDPSADKFLKTDGSGNLSFADAGGGKIGQVLQATDTTERTTTSTSFGLNSSGLTKNITPSATSSKILVLAGFKVYKESGNEIFYTVYRDSTNLGNGSSGFGYNNQVAFNDINIGYLDSPNTTSQVNYQIQFRSNDSSTAKLGYGNAYSHLTLFEVLA